MAIKNIDTTQKHLEIVQVKNGVILTKHRNFCAIIEAQPVNFALKSEDDQRALVGQFQNFLNSLSFPIQIVVHSRKVDIDPYLESLRLKAEEQTNELLQLQMVDYINFIKKLTELGNIMEKKFYVAVPLETAPAKKGFISSLLGTKQNKLSFTQAELEKYETALHQRINLVMSGLNQMSLRPVQLDTQKIIEVFYATYNPEEAVEERLINVEKMESPIIKLKQPASSNSGQSNAVANSAHFLDNQTATEIQRTQPAPTNPPAPLTPNQQTTHQSNTVPLNQTINNKAHAASTTPNTK